MTIPDWQRLDLEAGVLREPTLEKNRLVVWLPENLEAGFRYWQRVGSVPGAEVTVFQGIGATAATSIRARQAIKSGLAKFLARFWNARTDNELLLPTGEPVESCGKRQSNLMLVWAEDGSSPLDEAYIRARWPNSNGLQKIGTSLYLVQGVESSPATAEPAPGQPQPPREQAEQLLAMARKSGDRQRVASALTDLGIVCFRGGDAKRSVALLEEALAIVRPLGDRSREADVLSNLGLAVLDVDRSDRGLELLHQASVLAHAADDRFAEKMALANLGMAYSNRRQPASALAVYEQALRLAREVGDRADEAELLWLLAIEHAELNQREDAINLAQVALKLFRNMRHPEANFLADHLQRYHLGGAGENGETNTAILDAFSASREVVASAWSPRADAGSVSDGAASGPGLLRMAITAAKSVARFVGSGLKPAPTDIYQQRLRTCATCEHHTGMRCKLCGCVTSVKAWMPHESCPVGKWPSVSSSGLSRPPLAGWEARLTRR